MRSNRYLNIEYRDSVALSLAHSWLFILFFIRLNLQSFISSASLFFPRERIYTLANSKSLSYHLATEGIEGNNLPGGRRRTAFLSLLHFALYFGFTFCLSVSSESYENNNKSVRFLPLSWNLDMKGDARSVAYSLESERRLKVNRRKRIREPKRKKSENDAKRECYVYIKTILIDWEIVIRAHSRFFIMCFNSQCYVSVCVAQLSSSRHVGAIM